MTRKKTYSIYFCGYKDREDLARRIAAIVQTRAKITPANMDTTALGGISSDWALGFAEGTLHQVFINQEWTAFSGQKFDEDINPIKEYRIEADEECRIELLRDGESRDGVTIYFTFDAHEDLTWEER